MPKTTNRKIAIAQLASLFAIQAALFIAALNAPMLWSSFGFGSILLYAISALTVVLGIVGFRSYRPLTRIGLLVAIFGSSFTWAISSYFEAHTMASSPWDDAVRFAGIVILLIVPAGYFLAYYDLLKSLNFLKVGSLITFGASVLFWALDAFVGAGISQTDVEMSNQMVVTSLMFVAALLAAVSSLVTVIRK